VAGAGVTLHAMWLALAAVALPALVRLLAGRGRRILVALAAGW